MIKQIVSFAFLVLCTLNSHSATWFAFSDVGFVDNYHYFDADSFSRNGQFMEIWMATVRNYPEDGVYNTKQKYSIDCKNQSLKIITIATYDKKGNLIETLSGNSKFEYVTPGSFGRRILKELCSTEFLKKSYINSNSAEYFKVPENDIYKYSALLFEASERYLEKKKLEKQEIDSKKSIAEKQLQIEVESSLKIIFLRAKNQGIDYNDPKQAAMFDRYANFFATDPDFVGKTVREIHEEAHRNVLLRLGKVPVTANSSGRDLFKEAGIDPNPAKPQGRDLFEELGIDPKAPMPKEKSSTK